MLSFVTPILRQPIVHRPGRPRPNLHFQPKNRSRTFHPAANQCSRATTRPTFAAFDGGLPGSILSRSPRVGRHSRVRVDSSAAIRSAHSVAIGDVARKSRASSLRPRERRLA